MKQNVVALFPKYDEAELAVHELLAEGVEKNDVSVMAAGRGAAERRSPAPQSVTDVEAREKTGAGAVVGGVAGALLGLTALAIPGVGPVLAAGPLLAAITGAGGGAVAGGLIGAFAGLGFAGDEARYYAKGVEEGGAVVAVAADPQRVSTIAARLREMHAERVRENAAAGAAEADVDPADVLKTASGPEHRAPVNPGYASSFDEFAGVFVSSDSMLFAERSPEDYPRDQSAYEFGRLAAGEARFAAMDWETAQTELQADWRKRGREDWGRVHPAMEEGWRSVRRA